MAILTLRELSVSLGHPPLLDRVSCQIEPGQRIGLLGRNGSGKSTLLRIMAGLTEPDGGEVALEAGQRLAYLPQDVPRDLHGTIRAVIADGLQQHAAHDAAAADHDWQAHRQIDNILTRMDLDGETQFSPLSAGMKRRVLLARALAATPDLLLLDEPTNHLDLDAILWLEGFLARFEGTVVFVTHDRAFLRRLATRILEIDRGRLFDWTCDYNTFLTRKEAAIAAEERQEALFDKKLAREEVWIRQGVQARRTRNEGRVRALEAMRVQRQDRRPANATMNLDVQNSGRAGTLVVETKGLGFAYENGRRVVDNFSTTILRGDKIGIVGRNGAGKTTLLRLMLGQLAPDSGKVKLGANLEIAYFDQLRDQIDLDASVQDNVGGGAETIQVGGRNRHIMGYLEDFLFSRERARMPARLLSGGERMRVMLARLFARPANVIVLDEPTNDLDSESLEMLEDRLVEFPGTVLLVSHDREFLDNVVGSVIAFEDDTIREYVGGYADWQRQKAVRAAAAGSEAASKTAAPRPAMRADKSPASAPAKQRLSFKEKAELTALTAEIESREAEIARIHEAMAQPDYYQRAAAQIAKEQTELRETESRLTTALARWEELESRA